MTQENSRPLGEAPIQLATSREVAEERLQQQIARGEEIITRQPRSPQSARGLIQDSKSWARFTSELLSHLFSTAEYRSEFDDERTAALMYGSGETPQEEVRIAIDATEEQLNSLRTIR